MSNKTITIRAGDTEPLEVTITAGDVSNLGDVSAVAWYFEKDGTTHVDGYAGSVSDSANKKVQLDPDGAKSGGGTAFDAAGTYNGYCKLTWSDGDITRHPASADLYVRVIATQE